MSPRQTDRPRGSRRRRLRFLTATAALALAAALLPTVVAEAPQWVAAASQPSRPQASTGEGTGGRAVQPRTSVPRDEPAKGKIYKGLRPAPKGAPCVGGFELAASGKCTHGPDAPPPGVNVNADARPVGPAVTSRWTAAAARVPTERELARESTETLTLPAAGEAAAAAPAAAGGPSPAGSSTAAASGVICDGDGQSGKRVQVLYLYEAGRVSRFDQYLTSFRTWAAGADEIYNLSAQDTGGSRHIRYVTEADCQVSVVPVELPGGSLGTFDATISALEQRGFDRTDRKYMIFADTKVYCGIGTHIGDERKNAKNRNNFGPSYGRTDTGCWGASTPAHELGHNLGAVNGGAPNTSNHGHCVDEYDLMCYPDAPGVEMRIVCGDRAFDRKLDCRHDDYYSTDPQPGSYLAKNWNTADNEFLVAGTGTGPAPAPKPTPTSPTAAPTATPAPTPTASPTPSPTVTPPPAGQRDLAVGPVTGNRVRLSWAPAAGVGVGGAVYGVLVNDRLIGRTYRTAVTVTGLVPDTEYRFRVAVRDRDGREQPYTRSVTVRTAPLQQGALPATVMLHNSLTGMAVDAVGGSFRDGVPLIQYAVNGYLNQRWTLTPGAGGTVTLRSAVSGKCVQPYRGRLAAGTAVVQQACDGSAGQRWRLVRTRHGYALSTADGRLVLGVGSLRYAGERLLALQPPTGARYQSWNLTER